MSDNNGRFALVDDVQAAMQEDAEDQAFADLETADQRMYFAAKQYVAVTEAGFVQHARNNLVTDDPSFIAVGQSASELAQAAARYQRAYVQAFGECTCGETHDSDS